VRLQRDNLCFACGKENPRGLKMDIEIDSEGARCEYLVPADLQGWQGFAHGGIISTLLDEIMVWAAAGRDADAVTAEMRVVWAAAGRDADAVTAEMRVRFKNPLPTNHAVKVEGRITGERKRLIIAQAKAFDDHKVYAEATAKLFKL
jgi:acyl-coenzyme A thioesterase PaaI-like protein